MPKLQVTPTGKRMAFDIVDDCPDYAIRHSAKAVFVHCDDVVREARLRTYTNDSVPFGPTIRFICDQLDFLKTVLPQRKGIFTRVSSSIIIIL